MKLTSMPALTQTTGMTLKTLLAGFSDQSPKNAALASREVSALCFDSRKLQRDCVYVAIKGAKADGHAFIEDAVKAGALGLVVEETANVPLHFDGLVAKVANSRDTLNKLSARFFGLPAESLFNIGVTGTNGKTTTTHMIEAIMNHHGLPTGVIGTINHHLGTHVWATELTTPDPLSFQERLKQFKDLGAKAVAMEVSSIGLRQNRVDEVPFDVAVFTNLSRDHLDYHKDMEDYFDAKKKLYTELLAKSTKAKKYAIINGDDEYGQRLLKEASGTVWSYGVAPSSNLRIEVLEQGFFGTRFALSTPQGKQEFRIQMTGLHNVYNATAAIGAALAAGVPLAACSQALANLTGVKGRLEAVPNKQGFHVFVDYAHSDDAIETVLKYLNGIRQAAGLKNKIITVFGCGGDRDKGKRPLMMKAAERNSDLVVVTSDNPRTEDPEQIVRDALAGASAGAVGKKVHSVVDRRRGIRRALELASPGDVILIAGKGHEDYQQIGTTKYPFSDVEVVKEILQ